MEKKQVRRTFTLEEKSEIIWRLQNGENNTNICKELQVPHSTISTIWKNREKIQEDFKYKSLKRKRDRKSKYRKLEEILVDWFRDQASKNISLSNRVLLEKANEYAKILGNSKAISAGWIYRFRQRYDISLDKFCNRTPPFSKFENNEWLKNIFPKLRQEYSDEEVYSADETGLYYKLTPEGAFNFQGEICANGEYPEERITILVAASIGGIKRKLLVIGNSENPRSFDNITHLPVDYVSNKKAWMTPELFESTLHRWDAELREQGKKIILFIDHCLAHPPIDSLTNIKLAFHPSSTSSVMERGVFSSLKNHYRRILVLKMVNHFENKSSPFTISLLDAIEMLQTAWERVPPEIIQKCFFESSISNSPTRHTFDIDDYGLDRIPLAELSSMWATEDSCVNWENYIDVDDHLVTSNLEMMDNVVPDSIIIPEEGVKVEREDEVETVGHVPSLNDALDALTTLKKFVLFSDGREHIDMQWVIQTEKRMEKIFVQERELRQNNMIEFKSHF